ncbi:MAG: hypothetical protein JRN15_00990 [Nitrososphaerota archaeon]|nr:hypothetical protein [Nitrososphaerota archaeon]
MKSSSKVVGDSIEQLKVLSGKIGHVQSNHCSVLLNYISLIESNLSELIDASQGNTSRIKQVQDDFAQMNLQVRQMLSDIDKLRLFSFGSEANYFPLKMNDYLANLAYLVLNTWPQNTFEFEFADNLGDVLASTKSLDAVLMQIIENSVDASDDNDSIYIDAKSVVNLPFNEDLLDQGGGKIQITITDSGNGIDPKIAERIFEPLFTTKNDSARFGLGLAIAREILNCLGGSVYVEDSTSNQTVVQVELPKYISGS